jgi:large subunit ribosomal protein L21
MKDIAIIKGKQYNIIKNKLLKINKVKYKNGQELFIVNAIRVYNTKIINIKIKAKVVKEKEEKRIVIFKKKRRKNYQRKLGYKQKYTFIKIEEIN